MKRHKLKIIGIIAVAVVICFYIYASNNRYITTKSGNYIYVTDTQSGETFLVRGTKKTKVVERLTAEEEQIQITSKPKLSDEELKIKTAIELAKKSSTLSKTGLENDLEIKFSLQERTDNYEAIGWSAKLYSGSIAVVGYILKEPAAFGDIKYPGYFFEVDTKENIVRSITKDGALHDKYKSTIAALKNEIIQTSR